MLEVWGEWPHSFKLMGKVKVSQILSGYTEHLWMNNTVNLKADDPQLRRLHWV